jgi:hypothetical protein
MTLENGVKKPMPHKTCDECGTLCHARRRACDHCGAEFSARNNRRTPRPNVPVTYRSALIMANNVFTEVNQASWVVNNNIFTDLTQLDYLYLFK